MQEEEVKENTKDVLTVVGAGAAYIARVFGVVCLVICLVTAVALWFVAAVEAGPLVFLFGFCAPVMTIIIVTIKWLDI